MADLKALRAAVKFDGDVAVVDAALALPAVGLKGWPSIKELSDADADILYQLVMNELHRNLQQAFPKAKTFRIVGKNKSPWAARKGKGSGAGGKDPDVVVETISAEDVGELEKIVGEIPGGGE